MWIPFLALPWIAGQPGTVGLLSGPQSPHPTTKALWFLTILIIHITGSRFYPASTQASPINPL